ncbi:MAG: SpoIID/LytB domain-containing protein, partial [Armatimonadota bacterium]
PNGRAHCLVLQHGIRTARGLATLALICALAMRPPCAASRERTVTIGIFVGRGLKSIQVTSPGAQLVSSATAGSRAMASRSWRFEAAGDRVRVSTGSEARTAGGFTIRPNDASTTMRIAGGGLEAATYRGSLAVRAHGGRLLLINWVLLEDYLRSVVPLELSADAAEAALRAQAVAARSYAVAAGDRHPGMPYDFCEGTHCQLYLGTRAESPRTDAAVRATKGQVLTHGGKAVEAPFHSCCGGATSAVEDVWRGGNPVPYLTGRSDIGPNGAYCRRSPSFRWHFSVGAPELLRAFRTSRTADPGGRLQSVRVLKRDAAGRATSVEIVGASRVTVSGNELRRLLNRTLGGDRMKSTRFAVGRQGDRYVFEGTGHGHGVGMCHWGAMARAEAGETYEQILQHYYSGVTLGKLP